MLAQLIPMAGGQPIVLDRDVTVVGRNRDVCDLFLNHGSVSKIHCLVVKTDGLLFIRDLGSSNGTRVNGQKVIRGALLPGDTLAFASIKFKVHLGPDEPVMRTDQTEAIPAYKSKPSKAKKSTPHAAKGSPVRAPISSSRAKPPAKSQRPQKPEHDSDSDVRLLSEEDDNSSDELDVIE